MSDISLAHSAFINDRNAVHVTDRALLELKLIRVVIFEALEHML